MVDFTIVERRAYPEDKTWLIVGNKTNVLAELTKVSYDNGFEFNVEFGFLGNNSSIYLYGTEQFHQFKALVAKVDQFIAQNS